MACKDCKYYDENERWGSKGYCTWYRRYYYENDTCSHFTKRSGGGCFLTTACCEHMGKPDDCYELTMMRKLRDEYIIKQLNHQDLIDEYYSLAPSIVEKLNSENNFKELYSNIYSVINVCAKHMENKNFESAFKEYQDMFESLKKTYC